jgi:proline iminopeptidase
MKNAIVALLALLWMGCNRAKPVAENSYFNYSKQELENAGVKMVEVQTPRGKFKVWTRKIGNNPRIKILLLHGGPALTHEYMECFEPFFWKGRL